MTIKPAGTGDEKLISEMSDEQIIAERNYWNELLEAAFYVSSGTYDAAAAMLRELEEEMKRRDLEGPPWNAPMDWIIITDVGGGP